MSSPLAYRLTAASLPAAASSSTAVLRGGPSGSFFFFILFIGSWQTAILCITTTNCREKAVQKVWFLSWWEQNS